MENVLFKEKRKIEKLVPSVTSGGALSTLISVGIIILSAFLIFNSLRSIQISREKIGILNQAQNEVSSLRLKNITLILQKETIETDDYTETDIRNRLNYSKKGEYIFVIPDAIYQESLKKVNQILAPAEKETVALKVWEQWYYLFINGI